MPICSEVTGLQDLWPPYAWVRLFSMGSASTGTCVPTGDGPKISCLLCNVWPWQKASCNWNASRSSVADPQWETAHSKTIMMSRIVHGLIAVPSGPPISIPSEEKTRGHNLQFLQAHCRILAYQHSIFPSGICLWNHLPASVVSPVSLDQFRNKLSNRHSVNPASHFFFFFTRSYFTSTCIYTFFFQEHCLLIVLPHVVRWYSSREVVLSRKKKKKNISSGWRFELMTVRPIVLLEVHCQYWVK